MWNKVKDSHDTRVRYAMPGRFHAIGGPGRMALIEKLKDFADEITEWQGTYSLNIHSSGTVLDFWFESEQDAMLFQLKL
jgi:hypothetical protein